MSLLLRTLPKVILISILPSFLFAEDAEVANFFKVPSDDEAKLALEQVDGTLQRGDFDSAARLLSLILEHSQQDGRLVEDGDFFVPVHIAVSTRLEKLPKDAKELFSVSVEPQAKQALQNAKSPKSLLEILRCYPLSKTAEEAALLLLDYSLERGDGATAMLAVSFLKKKNSPFLPYVQLKAYVAESLRGNSENLRRFLEKQDVKNRDSLLRFAVAAPAVNPTSRQSNIHPYGTLPLKVEECASLLKSVSILTKTETLSAGKQNLFPLLLEERIYICNIARIEAYDCSGRLLFSRNFSEEETEERNTCPVPATLATDGKLLFGVFWSDKEKKNHLYALNLKGETVWSTSDIFDPFLTRLKMCSAPLVANGSVFVAAYLIERADCHLYIISFTVEGRFAWATYIGSSKNIPPAVPALPRIQRTVSPQPLSPVSLSSTEETLLFCTNSGAAGALDLTSGSIEWIHLYPIRKERKPAGPPPITFFEDDETQSVFNPPFVNQIVHKEKTCQVLSIAPMDSDIICGFDTENRRILWVLPRYRKTFLSTLDDGNLVLAEEEKEKRRLTLINPPTGRVLWQGSLTDSILCAPTTLKDGLLVPLDSSATLLLYDKEKKRLREYSTTTLPKLRPERQEGRFFTRTIPAVHASGLFFSIKETIFVLHPAGTLAILGKK
ncbi:MAG: PQQ-like beta-propeller repeat protein [Planctomycetota bacterium]|nr:PQQ-like beta-propeller repeat protein [Planctomycetota bacterium]